MSFVNTWLSGMPTLRSTQDILSYGVVYFLSTRHNHCALGYAGPWIGVYFCQRATATALTSIVSLEGLQCLHADLNRNVHGKVWPHL